MGTELFGPRVKEENMEISSIPPGFESLVHKISSYCVSAGISGTQTIQIETEFERSDDLKFNESFRHRPWINYSQFDNKAEESDSLQITGAVNQGKLVPEDVIFGLLSKKLEECYCIGVTGFILDGIPRDPGSNCQCRLSVESQVHRRLLGKEITRECNLHSSRIPLHGLLGIRSKFWAAE